MRNNLKLPVGLYRILIYSGFGVDSFPCKSRSIAPEQKNGYVRNIFLYVFYVFELGYKFQMIYWR